MDLLQHTTCEEVRSVLGVSAKELADRVITLPHWTLTVEQELRDFDGGVGAVLTQFNTIFLLDETTRTANQTQFFKVVNMYVLYSVSFQLLKRADVFSPQNITDGKAAVQRLADRFLKLQPAIEGGMQRLKDRVKDAMQILDPTAAVVATVSRTMFIGVGLGTDPVSGV